MIEKYYDLNKRRDRYIIAQEFPEFGQMFCQVDERDRIYRYCPNKKHFPRFGTRVVIVDIDCDYLGTEASYEAYVQLSQDPSHKGCVVKFTDDLNYDAYLIKKPCDLAVFLGGYSNKDLLKMMDRKPSEYVVNKGKIWGHVNKVKGEIVTVDEPKRIWFTSYKIDSLKVYRRLESR